MSGRDRASTPADVWAGVEAVVLLAQAPAVYALLAAQGLWRILRADRPPR